MFFGELFSAAAVTLLFTLIFAVAFHRSGPWENIAAFFVLLLLATWAAGLWARPVGPEVMGFYWVPYFMAGLVFGTLLAAAIKQRTGAAQTESQKKREKALDAFLWVLLIILALMVLGGYILPPEATPA